MKKHLCELTLKQTNKILSAFLPGELKPRVQKELDAFGLQHDWSLSDLDPALLLGLVYRLHGAGNNKVLVRKIVKYMSAYCPSVLPSNLRLGPIRKELGL